MIHLPEYFKGFGFHYSINFETGNGSGYGYNGFYHGNGIGFGKFYGDSFGNGYSKTFKQAVFVPEDNGE